MVVEVVADPDRNAAVGFLDPGQHLLIDTAELRTDQGIACIDAGADVLDAILKLYIEDRLSSYAIVKMGYDEEIVKKVVKLVDLNEYKRRQCPPGVKVSTKAFGKDRRMPITHGYRG